MISKRSALAFTSPMYSRLFLNPNSIRDVYRADVIFTFSLDPLTQVICQCELFYLKHITWLCFQDRQQRGIENDDKTVMGHQRGKWDTQPKNKLAIEHWKQGIQAITNYRTTCDSCCCVRERIMLYLCESTRADSESSTPAVWRCLASLMALL